MALDRIDLPADRPDELRADAGTARFLRIPAHRFVMVDGSGPPEPRAFEVRLPGLYGTAYGLRFALQRRGVQGSVGPLEGLWSHGLQAVDPDAWLATDRSGWHWTLMIGLPDEATARELDEHLAVGRTKVHPTVVESLRIERFEEGEVAQILHVGPFEQERPTIERLHAAIAGADRVPRGRHHEIYLSDPTRCAPERLQTILRQPIRLLPRSSAVPVPDWRRR